MGCGISKLDDPKEAAGALPRATPNRTSICFTGETNSPPHSDINIVTDNNNAANHKEQQHSANNNNNTKFHDHHYSDDEQDDDDRGICRGASPSFREYCIDSDSISTSIRSTEDNCEGDQCKWQNDPDKGTESERGKKDRRGKRIMKALQRGKSGGVRNFLNASRRHHSNFSNNNNINNDLDDSSHNQKLLAKAS
ncbi:probable serine/threonine-protein kinase DDB_G0282963 [Momordica charantia]|uniref:Probable serine/threonine-protein kinase DDB_G0282963 n=1 Tax=Momordica charantia TaxID=3673 RepID=A0A6J1DV73_MOMCH|nr:probable serine/threonine-protein kinase DDB_G0282963 [Momordica charantia]